MKVIERIQDTKEKEKYIRFAKIIPFNVVGFGEDLGISIFESSELPPRVGGLIQKVDNVMTIMVNKSESQEKKRFIVAHELGHYFLHRTKLEDGSYQFIDGIDVFYQSEEDTKLEDEANLFASDLLMPIENFIQIWNQKDYRVKDIATFFLVSENAVINRARQLKLTTSSASYLS